MIGIGGSVPVKIFAPRSNCNVFSISGIVTFAGIMYKQNLCEIFI
jgi:hypothetical protein